MGLEQGDAEWEGDAKTQGGGIGERRPGHQGKNYLETDVEKDRRMVDSDQVTPVLYSTFLAFGTSGRVLCLLSPSCPQKFKRMEPDSIHILGGSPGLVVGRGGDGGEKAVTLRWPKEGRGESKREEGVSGCCWSGPLGRQRGPQDLGASICPSVPEQPPSRFQFLLEMEGAAAGTELGLFRCLLCAWETPSRLAVLQHLRAPAHRDAQAQRRLQLLQSGPAADEGLSALQSILSFSHGQLRPPGEEEGTGEEEVGGEGSEGGSWGPRRKWHGDEKWGRAQSRASGKALGRLLKLAFRNTGAAEGSGGQEAVGGGGREEQGFCWVER